MSSSSTWRNKALQGVQKYPEMLRISWSMAETGILIMQLYLHHSKGVSVVLIKRMAMVRMGIALIQENLLYREKISILRGYDIIYIEPLD